MTATPYPIWDVSDWELMGTESGGLSEHEWLREPGAGSERGRLWLFKPIVEKLGFAQGEDWVEKVAYELGDSLGIPCARIELCRRSGQPGCLSQDLRQSQWEMQPGAVLISELVPDYEPRSKYRIGHNLTNIRHALANVLPPPELVAVQPMAAFDVFAGYLVFDALIANRDRHDENWAVLRPPPGPGSDHLSGSYDHASGLAFSLSDTQRTERLAHPGISAWAAKATAVKFEHHPKSDKKTLVQLASDALRLCSAEVRTFWTGQLTGLTEETIRSIFEAVPDLSQVTIDFSTLLLLTNRERILDEI